MDRVPGVCVCSRAHAQTLRHMCTVEEKGLLFWSILIVFSKSTDNPFSLCELAKV